MAHSVGAGVRKACSKEYDGKQAIKGHYVVRRGFPRSRINATKPNPRHVPLSLTRRSHGISKLFMAECPSPLRLPQGCHVAVETAAPASVRPAVLIRG